MQEQKLLIRINGETTVQRQVRLLLEIGQTDITVVLNKVTGSKVLATMPDDVLGLVTETEHKHTLLETLAVLPCVPKCNEILVLLGDLVYSKDALLRMVKATGWLTVFGIEKPTSWACHRWGGEIFALKVASGYVESVKAMFSKLDPSLHHGLWNIPKQMSVPIVHLEECTDIDTEGDVETAKTLLSNA